MAYPTPVVSGFSFTDEQTANPSTPLPGSSLDVELAALRAYTANLNAFIDTTIRSDGQLNNGIVTLDKLDPNMRRLVAGGSNFTGAWATATAYAVGNAVQYSNTIYLCQVAHTSGVFAADLAAGRWAAFSDTAVVNLKDDFGAIGDGVTDDSAAIVAAEAYSGGEVIYVPPGTYAVTGVTFTKIYYGEGRIELDGVKQAERLSAIYTPPPVQHTVAANLENFYVGDGAFADRKMLRLSEAARLETAIGEGANYINCYEWTSDMSQVNNGTGFVSGSGTTTTTLAGLGSGKISQDDDYRRVITGITAAASAVITVGSHNFVADNLVYIYGVVGTMGAVLNGSYHTITAVDATTITVSTSTAALAYTSGGLAVKRVNRTGLMAHRVFFDHWGLGDGGCYNAFARVSREVEGPSWLIGNAGVLYNGDVNMRANGTYGNPLELNCIESNDADAAAVGAVFNMWRYTDTSTLLATSGNQSGTYSAKDCIWLGVRPQSLGTKYCDALYSGAGKWKVGLDLTAVTLADRKVAVALKGDDRIHFNASAIVDPEQSNVAWHATDGINASDSIYLHYNVAGEKFELVMNGTTPFQVSATQLITTLRISSSVGVSVGGLGVLTARKTGWGVPFGTPSRAAYQAYTGLTATGTYTQWQIQQIDDKLKLTSQTLMALLYDLHGGVLGHGLIGT